MAADVARAAGDQYGCHQGSPLTEKFTGKSLFWLDAVLFFDQIPSSIQSFAVKILHFLE
jgi:hypothetical protein